VALAQRLTKSLTKNATIVIKIPNNCRCSELSVHPKNWQTKRQKLSVEWYISYRFYDPRHERPKHVVIKRMNAFKTVEERQWCVEELLKEEKKRLLDGHNPFSIVAPLIDKKKEENISLETALDLAYSKITVAPITKRDIKLSVDQIKKALQKLELLMITCLKIKSLNS